MASENSIRALLARARTKEAREGIQLADEVSDMILCMGVHYQSSWI